MPCFYRRTKKLGFFSWPTHGAVEATWQCPAGLDESVRALRALLRWNLQQDFVGRVEPDRVRLYVPPPPFSRSIPTVFDGAFARRGSGWVLHGRFAAPRYYRLAGTLFLALLAWMIVAGTIGTLVHWERIVDGRAPARAILTLLAYLGGCGALLALVRWQLRPKGRQIELLSAAIARALAARETERS